MFFKASKFGRNRKSDYICNGGIVRSTTTTKKHLYISYYKQLCCFKIEKPVVKCCAHFARVFCFKTAEVKK